MLHSRFSNLQPHWLTAIDKNSLPVQLSSIYTEQKVLAGMEQAVFLRDFFGIGGRNITGLRRHYINKSKHYDIATLAATTCVSSTTVRCNSKPEREAVG